MTTLVKICGLTRERDVDAAVAAGADLVGFVCVADSRRGVTIERARELASRVPAGVRTVAVFAGADPVSDTEGTVSEPQPAGFDLVQGYGRPVSFRDRIVGCRGEPPVDLPDGVPILLDLPRDSHPDRAELYRHWNAARGVRHPVILAGALDPDNVAEAIAVARPWAVDTARGVEVAPGIKHPELIERFVRAAKEA